MIRSLRRTFSPAAHVPARMHHGAPRSTSSPALGDPYWAPPPVRPFAAEVGADPGRLHSAYTARTPDGDLGHPDCVAAAEYAARLYASLGHEVA